MKGHLNQRKKNLNPYLSSKKNLNQRCILQRWYTYKSEYLREFETELKNIWGCEAGAHVGSIIEENQRSTISCYYTFKLESKDNFEILKLAT